MLLVIVIVIIKVFFSITNCYYVSLLNSTNKHNLQFTTKKESSYAAPAPATNFYSAHGQFHNPDTAQSLPVHSTTAAQQPRYFKISKDDLFKGLVPPTLFESSSTQPLGASDVTTMAGKSQIGTNCL